MVLEKCESENKMQILLGNPTVIIKYISSVLRHIKLNNHEKRCKKYFFVKIRQF